MKALLFFVILFPVFFAVSQRSYADSIQALRLEKQELILGSNKVLKTEELEKIISLDFFPTDTTWIKMVTFKKDKGKPFEMPTSTDRLPKYRRVGYVYFEHKGETHQLTLYKNLNLVTAEFKNYYFLPFKDLTSPNESYGAGRYIDIDINLKKNKEFLVDFNAAYNPYCAYSYRYSCPITPKENHLPIRIEVGEKIPIKLP